jgi:hypothetical protein
MAIDNDRTAVLEVNEGVQWSDVLVSLVRSCEIAQEQTWLEQGVFQDVGDQDDFRRCDVSSTFPFLFTCSRYFWISIFPAQNGRSC